MSSDLSSIIKDIVSSTIETNISKDSPISSIHTCDSSIFTNKHLVSVQSLFKFETLSLDIKFVYPAQTASYISNLMMMDDTAAIVDVVDEDIADALKEVTAQISGAMVTAINAQNYEDLGSTEYTSGDLKILDAKDYDQSDNLILLSIDTDNSNLEIYIEFDEESIKFVDDFSSSIKKEYISTAAEPEPDESSQNEEESQDTESEQETADSNEDNDENKDQEQTLDENKEDIDLTENSEALENESSENKNDKKLKMLVIIIASLLGLVIIIFLILFFMGNFDEKEVIKLDNNKTKLSKRDMLLSNIKNKEITYKSSLIDVPKLNKRLAILTKYEILEEDILEEYKTNEKERLYKLKMSRLEEFALQNKEESLFKKDIQNLKKENRFKDNNTSNNILSNAIDANTKLTFIQIDAINYKKYSKIINTEKTKNTSISMCKSEKEKIKVYVGPLYLKIVINNIMKKVNKVDAKLLIITQKEFDERCNF